jgi:RNA-directed DNA polymerase
LVNVAQEMKHLRKLSGRDPGKRFNRLWKNMSSETWLTQAWEEIRRNKGSRTPGVDRQTAEDISPERIQALSERLRNKTYRPTPVRRVHIPKGNGKTRPLDVHFVNSLPLLEVARVLKPFIFKGSKLAQDL